MNALRISVLSILSLFFLVSNALATQITGQERAMMIEAARLDLYAQLARQIKGLQVTDSTLVANHVTEASSKTGYVEAVVKGATVSEPRFVDDICIISGEITLQQVVENLNQISRQSGNSSYDFTSVERKNEYRVVRAQGTGTRKVPKVNTNMVATGESEAGLEETIRSLSGTGQEKLGAIEAARIDALAQLARQIKGLQLSDTSVVYNMATDARWTQASTNALVKGAIIKRFSSPASDLVACTAEIHLQQVVENIQKSYTEFSNGKTISIESIKRQNPDILTITATGYGAIGRGQTGTMQQVAPTGFIGSVQ